MSKKQLNEREQHQKIIEMKYIINYVTKKVNYNLAAKSPVFKQVVVNH
jgi:hypothetical protein